MHSKDKILGRRVMRMCGAHVGTAPHTHGVGHMDQYGSIWAIGPHPTGSAWLRHSNQHTRTTRQAARLVNLPWGNPDIHPHPKIQKSDIYIYIYIYSRILGMMSLPVASVHPILSKSLLFSQWCRYSLCLSCAVTCASLAPPASPKPPRSTVSTRRFFSAMFTGPGHQHTGHRMELRSPIQQQLHQQLHLSTWRRCVRSCPTQAPHPSKYLGDRPDPQGSTPNKGQAEGPIGM